MMQGMGPLVGKLEKFQCIFSCSHCAFNILLVRAFRKRRAGLKIHFYFKHFHTVLSPVLFVRLRSRNTALLKDRSRDTLQLYVKLSHVA